jgi:oligopeptide/dipeptide ABC transporter ATP-binding protein
VSRPLLEVDHLEIQYPLRTSLFRRSTRMVNAVAGIDLHLAPGELLALVGESGCGKTSVARALVGLQAPTAGVVRFDGQNIATLRGPARQAWRRGVQMVFQDPYDSLNPSKTVFDTLAQPLRIHAIVPATERRAEAIRLLDRVGLSPGAQFLDRFPHQFSGGQRQRVCIARAIATRPRLLIADEPVSALDVSISAQILRLFKELATQMHLASIFITHDLGVVRSISDRVAVMYLGRIVEQGPTERVFQKSGHPYTATLLAASPMPDPTGARRAARQADTGDPPSPLAPPPGCHFHTRCRWRQEICTKVTPTLVATGNGAFSACHFAHLARQWAPSRSPEAA